MAETNNPPPGNHQPNTRPHPAMSPVRMVSDTLRPGPPLIFPSQESKFFNLYSTHQSPFIARGADLWNVRSQNTAQWVASTGQQLALQEAPPEAPPGASPGAPPNDNAQLVKSSAKQQGNVNEFRGYDDENYEDKEEDIEDGEVRSETGDTTESYSSDDENNYGQHMEIIPEHRTYIGMLLSDVDTRNLTPAQVLFYFGVLTLQEDSLQPAFEYTQEAGGRWSAKLTMYQDSLRIPSMKSLVAAKVEVCRVALSILKMRYGGWRVPDEPSENISVEWWYWGTLLQTYTRGRGMPAAEYARYVHKNGYRYQAEVGAVIGLGKRRFYSSEDHAIEAASHEVLYLLLTQELRELRELRELSEVSAPTPDVVNQPVMPSSQMSRPIMYSMAAGKSEPISVNTSNVKDHPIPAKPNVSKQKNAANAANKVTKPRRAEPKPRRRSRGNKRGTDFMSNLVPVLNPRISMPKKHSEIQQARKWSVSPRGLIDEIKNLQTCKEKYDKICNVLRLNSKLEVVEDNKKNDTQQPEEQSTPPTYSAWATFQNDPFLTRAGAVGKVSGFVGTEAEAQEACCKMTVEFLLKMVEEDYTLEQAEHQQRMEVENFVEWKRDALKAGGQ